jgi:two-component system sensor histidine kinase KdpD
LDATLRLVESLGGEATVLRGANAAVEAVRYARARGVTKIVVGRPAPTRWRTLPLPTRSFVDEVVRESREIDVHVVSDHPTGATESTAPIRRRQPRYARVGPGYAAGVVVVATCALVAWFIFGHSQLADVAMVFLLGVIVVSMRFGYGPSLLAAVLSVLSFNFFFIPPYFSFAVANLRHTVTFAVMFFVAFVVSHLTKRIRDQADAARYRERQTASLYAISREIGLAHSQGALLESAVAHAREVFGAEIALWLPGAAGVLESVLPEPEKLANWGVDARLAQWCWVHDQQAGAGTETESSARSLYIPLKGSHGRVGVLALLLSDASRFLDPDEHQLFATFAGLVGPALERTKLADEARRARLRIETERLRNALLSSVSHDLRTPLGVVIGATSAFLEPRSPEDERSRRRLVETAHAEALRLNRLVGNLLDMTRLEAGALRVSRELHSLEEVVGAALNRLDDRLQGREIGTNIAADLPLVPFDSVLIEQVLINVIENATKYTPPGSPIDITALVREGSVEVEVADRGPGVPSYDAERIFDKFYRVREREGGGVGLGLTICRGIVSAHGGRIWVAERARGGASFRFTLPLRDPAGPGATAAMPTGNAGAQ